MNERPSKKQRELLSFIEGFIQGNGYGPSYREIMRALDYKSVSTVAAHVDGLIKKGQLRKKDNSARTLEIVKESAPVESTHIAWLKKEIKKRINADTEITKKEAEVLGQALSILQDDEPAA